MGAQTKDALIELLHPHVDPGNPDTRRDGAYKVNLSTLKRNGMIEFRLHQATLIVDEARNWVELLQRFFHKAKSEADVVQAPADMSPGRLWQHMMQTRLHGGSDHLTDYYYRRIVDFDTRGPQRTVRTSLEERAAVEQRQQAGMPLHQAVEALVDPSQPVPGPLPPPAVLPAP
eukprot:907028-Prymnesium_polylepis.1